MYQGVSAKAAEYKVCLLVVLAMYTTGSGKLWGLDARSTDGTVGVSSWLFVETTSSQR